MGWSNYCVSDKLKLMFEINRSINDDMIDELKDNMNNIDNMEDIIYTGDWSASSLSKKPLKEVAQIIAFYDALAGMHLQAKIFCLWMRVYDSNAYIVDDAGNKVVELEKKGYRRIIYE
jgi:hypothetical protein